MPLKLLPLPKSEWETYFRISWSAFRPGIMGLIYPNGFSPEALQHSTAALRRTDDQYPGRLHIFKVIDTDLPDSDEFDQVVGVSQWKLFPRGRTDEELQKEKEISEKDDEVYGDTPGLFSEPIEEFHTQVTHFRDKHLGRKPHMILHVLATRDGHHRRGIGALSMKWGTDKADELGLPLFLEGSEKGVGLYAKWGFEAVDKMEWDASKYGYHSPLPHVCMLRPAKAKA